jgi:hypothetical protein
MNMWRSILTFFAFSGYAWANMTGWQSEVRSHGLQRFGCLRRGGSSAISTRLGAVSALTGTYGGCDRERSFVLRPHGIQGCGQHLSLRIGGSLHKGQLSLRCLRSGLRSVSTFGGSLDGLFCRSQSIPHVFGLFFHRAPLQIHQTYKTCGKQEIQGAGNDRPPSVRKFLIALGAGILLVYGWQFAERRGVPGRLFVTICFGLFWSSLILVFLSGFRWSWGWWL